MENEPQDVSQLVNHTGSKDKLREDQRKKWNEIKKERERKTKQRHRRSSSNDSDRHYRRSRSLSRRRSRSRLRGRTRDGKGRRRNRSYSSSREQEVRRRKNQRYQDESPPPRYYENTMVVNGKRYYKVNKKWTRGSNICNLCDVPGHWSTSCVLGRQNRERRDAARQEATARTQQHYPPPAQPYAQQPAQQHTNVAYPPPQYTAPVPQMPQLTPKPT